MARLKTTPNRRLSLCPPHGDKSKPNASMVDLSNIEISVRRHIRQRDQHTATKEEHEQKINEQRPSLVHAEEMIDYWKKRDSTNTQINVKNHIQSHNQEPKGKSDEECTSLHHAVGLTNSWKTKSSPNHSTNVQTNKDQVKK